MLTINGISNPIYVAVIAAAWHIPSLRHRVQHARWYAGWIVLHRDKESPRKIVKIRNYMIYWGKRGAP